MRRIIDGIPNVGRTVVAIAKPVARIWKRDFLEPLIRNLGGPEVMEIEDGERGKNLAHLQKLFESLIALKLDRCDIIVAVGGGTLTDLVGFAAAVWMRGLRWVVVPTTMVGQVDAALGGKTGVDYQDGKNMVGAFWMPEHVLLAPALLATLRDRDRRDGLTEILKTGLALSPALFKLLEKHADAVLAGDMIATRRVVRACAGEKLALVALDERERDVRRVLNLGHTVAHAVEACGRFQRWSHGEAVAMGMLVMTSFSAACGIMEANEADRVRNLIARLGLAPKKPPHPEEIEKYLWRDKKKQGDRLMIVAPGPIGRARIIPADAGDLTDRKHWSWRKAMEV